MIDEALAAAAAALASLQFRDFIAAGALVLSIILAFREFSKRPRLTPWMQVQRVYDGATWEHVGLKIHVGNTGATSLIVESVGQVNPNGSGTVAPSGTFTMGGETYENPALPFALSPGEMVTFRFPGDSFPEKGKYKAVEIKSRLLRLPFAARGYKRIDHRVKDPKVVPMAKANPPVELMR